MSGDLKPSGLQKRSRSSLKRGEKVTSDDSPPKKADSPTYKNVFGTTWSKAASTDARHENTVVRKGSSYENVSTVGKDGRPLTSHHSEPTINMPNGNGYDDVVLQPKKPRAETAHVLNPGSARARLLHANSSADFGECPRCEELEQLLAMWELGVSGFARNYSMILAQLNKVRDASVCLESKMKQRAGMESSIQSSTVKNSNLSVSHSPSLKVRHSMLDNGLQIGEPKLADHMYPPEKREVLPPDYTKYLGELNTHLGKAMDLCQKLAAACFKKNQSALHRSHPGSKKKHPLTRLNSQPDPCPTKPVTPPTTPYRPSLVSISENNLSGTLERKREAYRMPSAPVTLRWDGTEQEATSKPSNDEKQEGLDLDGKMPETNSTAAQNAVEKQTQSNSNSKPVGPNSELNSESSNFEEPPPKPYHSHMMSLLEADEQRRSAAPSYIFLDSQELSKTQGEENEGASSSINRDSVLSCSSAFSDGDVKQVMSKIADLEEERIKLLETIDGLHQDNQHVRLSLCETLGDLENKDLQLTLAMQDLFIATDEIKRAAAMRLELQKLESDRQALLERLSNLEDESAAVKVSLIQLLQQKSATNKTLALENLRLSQKMKQLSNPSLQRRSSRSSHAQDADTISVTSNVTTEEDAAMQGAYMGLEDAGCFVHKQGFLVKQGGKVKNWKKRLFVLDSDGLSYYKTEQPITKLPLSGIEEVQVCHGRTAYPNMFEVHTRDRVYFLSAPTEDEMQSWVGMVQTLKQYDKQRKQTSRGNHAWTFQSSSPRLPTSPHSPSRRAASEGNSGRKKAQPKKNAVEEEEDEEEEEENGTDIPLGRACMSAPMRSFVDEEDITIGSLNLAQLQKPL